MNINQKENNIYQNLLLKSTIDEINKGICNQSIPIIISFLKNEIINKITKI
jgi:hypothetical protein